MLFRYRRALEKMWEPEPLFKGSDVFLIGGGPSLRGFDFERLRTQRCLAINESVIDVPWADVLFFRDYEWFSRRAAVLAQWPGQIFTTSPGAARDWPDRIFLIKSSTATMPRARTSGQQAVSLALLMRAKRIVLLGFDWNRDGGNYHDRYSELGLEYYGGIMDAWSGYRDRAARQGTEIINATPGSQISEFYRWRLDDLL